MDYPVSNRSFWQLELRLDQSQAIALRSHQRCQTGGQTGQRGKTQVGYQQCKRRTQKSRVCLGDIGSLKKRHTAVVAQFPVKLTITHINSDNMRRSALEQTIGEPSCGRPHIDATEPSRLKAKIVQSPGQLETTARNILPVLTNLDPGIRLNQAASLSLDSTINTDTRRQDQALGFCGVFCQAFLNKQIFEMFSGHEPFAPAGTRYPGDCWLLMLTISVWQSPGRSSPSRQKAPPGCHAR